LCWPTYAWPDVNTPVPFRAYDGKCWVVENRTRNGHEANVYVCIAGRRGQWSGVSTISACPRADETFPTITPDDLRHTAASLAVSAHANVKAVQRMLGHAKASMTLEIYAHLFDEDLDGVADRLDAAIQATADALRTAPKA
jgi:site-specific recombinase XerC